MASLESAAAVQRFKYSSRVVLKSIVDREDRGLGLAGQRVVVGGWVKSRRDRPASKAAAAASPTPSPPPAQPEGVSCYEVIVRRVPLFAPLTRILGKRGGFTQEAKTADVPLAAYLHINDGSCSAKLQVVISSSMSLTGQVITVGASVLVEGVLEKVLAPKRDNIELKVEKVLHVGAVDSKKYPLAKPKLSLEFLRAYPHLRSRSITIGSVARIRSCMTFASHEFFQKNGFIHVHMPVITSTKIGSSNGKMFQVTTLMDKLGLKYYKSSAKNDRNKTDEETIQAAIKVKSKMIEELKRTDSNKEALCAAEQDLQRAKELAILLEEKRRSATITSSADLDTSKDFFSSNPAYLTVSSGLHLESYACALSSVYAIGPVFQADESSQPGENLAEKWTIEVELAFAELEDAMSCAEDLLKFLCRSLLENSGDDLEYASKLKEKHCTERLQSILSGPFARITYSEALDVLNKVNDKPLKAGAVEWGYSLSQENQSYLADEAFKKPIIIYDYPKELKPFYVRVREDGRTASAFDVIAPKGGVVLSGSQKEERVDVISKRIQELGRPSEEYDWYLDLRKYGSVKHSGFCLGLEKMIMFATGLTDEKDVIPFPRTRGCADM